MANKPREMTRLVLLILLLTTGAGSQSCVTNSPTLNMCHTGSVHGPAVTIDVTSAADGNFTSCNCYLTSNVSGLYVDFHSTPDAGNCSTVLDLYFDDVSMQLRCGKPAGLQYTNGHSAQVIYSMLMTTDSTDSSYCLTFYNNVTGIDIQLDCYAPTTTAVVPSTTVAGNQSATVLSTTTSSTDVSFNTLNTTVPTTTFTATSNTTTSPSMNQSRASTVTTTTTPPTTLPVTANSTSSSVNTSNNFDSNTTSSTFISKYSTSTPTTPSSFANTTLSHVGTSTAISPTNTTATTTDAPTTLHNNKTVTSSDNNNTTSSDNSTSSSLTTSLASTGNASSEFKTIGTIPPSNKNNTTSMDNTGNTTTTTINTTSSTFSESTTSSSASDNSTSADNTNATLPNNTSAVSNNTTYTNWPFNTSNTTSSVWTSTEAPNVTDDNSTETTPSLNTTDTVSNSTELPDNTTVDLNNTTIDGNATLGDNNITEPAEVTTDDSPTTGFWMPPDAGYGANTNKSSVVVVLVPIIAVLLLVFITVVTYIMCKRSKKAARQTKSRNGNKANSNNNKTDMNKNESVKKSENYFVAQHSNKNQSAVVVEDETKEIDKKVVENGASKANESVAQNDELAKAMETLDTSILMANTNGKPKVYEPTERERDLLENLELSSIVIEHDPDDPNRYFKKSDPGDWYRVIMKGKTAKGEKKKSKSKKSKESSRRHSSQTDTSDITGDAEKRRRRKSAHDLYDKNGTSRHKQKHRKSKSRDKNNPERSRSKSVDFSKAYEAIFETGKLNDASFSMTGASATLPINYKESSLRDSGRFKQAETKAVEPKLIASKPIVVDSKPSEPDPPKPRVIMSQPSKVNTQAIQEAHTVQEIAQQVNNPPPNVINSTPVRTREPVTVNTTQLQSSPARPRSNLFGSRGGSLKESLEQKASTETPVKRPDIVPPLNLTGTGDHVEIDEDGFEGFVLNN